MAEAIARLHSLIMSITAGFGEDAPPFCSRVQRSEWTKTSSGSMGSFLR